MRHTLLTIIFLLVAGNAWAGEISILGGAGWKDDPDDNSYAYQVQLLEGLGEHFAFSISYLNQGHFNDHHRDGNTANIWVRTNLLDRRLSLAIGLGGLYYFDTVQAGNGVSYNDHGWGGSASLAATWYSEGPWFFQMHGSQIWSDRSFESMTVMAGIGYQLNAPPSRGPETTVVFPATRTTGNELTLLGGETIVNNPGAGHSHAVNLEYRHGLWRFLEYTVGFLYEGKSTLIDRYGLTGQLWLAEPFLHKRLALAAGFGGYLAVDRRRNDLAESENNDAFLTEIISFSTSLRLDRGWLLRATWNRIVTSYDRDSDVLVGGIGYRF